MDFEVAGVEVKKCIAEIKRLDFLSGNVFSTFSTRGILEKVISNKTLHTLDSLAASPSKGREMSSKLVMEKVATAGDVADSPTEVGNDIDHRNEAELFRTHSQHSKGVKFSTVSTQEMIEHSFEASLEGISVDE